MFNPVYFSVCIMKATCRHHSFNITSKATITIIQEIFESIDFHTSLILNKFYAQKIATKAIYEDLLALKSFTLFNFVLSTKMFC